MKGYLIPVEGPVTEIEIEADENGSTLKSLQTLVGGYIEALPIPSFITDSDDATSYINEEGKLIDLPINRRGTDFFVPGIGLFQGDYIAGPLVILGFDQETGEYRDEVPAGVVRRIKKIASEAGDVTVNETGGNR